MALQPFVQAVDRLSSFIGKAFGWSIVGLTGVICYEVFARYLFRAPTTWAFDISYMLYGTLFMCAGAYALSRAGHVRADFLYRLAPARIQALLDFCLYFLFFFPSMAALVWFGWDFFVQSWHQNERSAFSPVGPYIWPFKFLIPAVGALMILQGAAETLRCIAAITTGRWPPREGDVKETEEIALEQARILHGGEPAR